MNAWRTDTVQRSAALRLQRRYRQHVHAVGSFARRAIDGNVLGGSHLRKPILDFDRHIVGKMGMPFSLTRFGLHTFRSEFSPHDNTFRSEHGDVEYTFSSEFTDKDISNEPANVVDSRFAMYQIRTCQCSKFVNFNVADFGYSFRQIWTDHSMKFAISNATDSAGCAYALQRLSYGPKYPLAEVYLDLPKPKPKRTPK